MTDLRDFIRTYDGAVPAALCDRMIALFEGAPQCHSGPRGRPLDQRDAERGFNWAQMNTSDLAAFDAVDARFVEHVNEHVGRYVADTGYTLFPYGFEEFLIKRYRAAAADQFPPHVDISSRNSMHRMLALLLYLNDVESGGETTFTKLEIRVQPRKGRLMLFPPTWLYPHAGLPPRSGEKYILGTYLIYVDPSRS
jgi:prolyl 4-hydroxylase